MAANYHYVGTYDERIFEQEFRDRFGKKPRYNANAIPDLLVLLRLISRDTSITDVRWAAYMLATVAWETTSPVTQFVQAKNKKGKPLVDKAGKAVMLKRRAWLMTMAPVDEVGHGKGRKYHEPVKVAKLADGSVRITEQDGDQFKVTAAGAISKLTKGAKMGTVDGGAADRAYNDDTGTELAYFGRGYVQLTWWSNYATTGAAIGQGLNLLLDPELVKTPAIAYAVMSHGMLTGDGFANGRKFSTYFSGKSRNYVGARAMVNGSDHAKDIAAIAEVFEAVLLAAGPQRPISFAPPIDSSLAGMPLPGARFTSQSRFFQ
ncbi:glycoside hydrolase family 19 protein [Bosea sp. LjRoot237]|uniref:glycoside hydrolase family 19 protein n=1 Tax=Bosea sp. LjRoot237 TaxID=3342292 RepID=UPI003ECD6F2F